MSSLFAVGKIKSLEIKNRIVLPPMVCFSFAAENGFVSSKNMNHYEAIAKGGTGLIIVEATCVNKSGRLSEDQLGIWSDDYIEGLSKLVRICHRHNVKVFIQLHHAGFRTPKSLQDDTITSSDFNDGKISARALTRDEIHHLEEDFINGAIRAEKAGFDGVELHGAHSYLMSQFFSTKVNNRTDEYGGNLDNRLRFTANVLRRTKEKVKDDFIIGIRMGCNENGLDSSISMARAFQNMGMDFLHISTGLDNTIIDEEVPNDFPCNWIVYGSTLIKKHVSIPVIAVKSIRTYEHMEHLISNDLVDLVAIGRPQLADYNFTNSIKERKDFISCIECKPCKWFTNGDYCPRNPSLL